MSDLGFALRNSKALVNIQRKRLALWPLLVHVLTVGGYLGAKLVLRLAWSFCRKFYYVSALLIHLVSNRVDVESCSDYFSGVYIAVSYTHLRAHETLR